MTPATGARPMRADAQRNRERLLTAAVRAYAAEGPDAALESIAKDAGVGIGTLYRHFPTREALVEAAYRSELARLCEAAVELLRREAPDRALRCWMDRYVGYVRAKRSMADALRAVAADGGNPFTETRARLLNGITALLDAGATAGTIRADVAPADVLAGLTGVTLAAGDPEQAGRMLDLLMDGLKSRGANHD